MGLTINEWSQQEAEDVFKRIEDKGNREWLDIDWKEELNYSDTQTNNTIQKAMSGFANTFGGAVVIGFANSSRILVGIQERANIENEIADKLRTKLKPITPHFKARYYDYKGKKVLVIFIPESKKPVFAENGVAYYRDQSQFLVMPYGMLERKFRMDFEEEKYIDLVKNDLKRTIAHSKDCLRMIASGNALSGATLAYSFSITSKFLIESGDKLYNYYKDRNLLLTYNELIDLVVVWLAYEKLRVAMPNNAFTTLNEKIGAFLSQLS